MELRDFIRVLKARWLVIVASTLVGALAAFGWVLAQPKVYTADASGLVQSVQNDSVAMSYTSSTLATQRVASYVELGKLRSVAQYAIDQLGLETSPEALVGRVSVSNPTDTLIIRVEAEAATPEAARDLAQAWVEGMALEVNEMETGDPNATGNLRLAPRESAELPTEPSSPNKELALALGLLIGFTVGLTIALVQNYIDRRIRSVEDVEREVDSAVIGTVPLEKALTVNDRLIVNPATGESKDELFAVSESLRALRTNISFADVDNPPRVIVVSSPLPGDGKSTIAANLAMSMAANGQPTVLIDADLRRPMQSTIFNLPSGAGLTDILLGKTTLDAAAHAVGDAENMLVIPAGSIPPNPSEVLGSDRMKQLLAEIREEAMVVIDAPPVLPVTDAAVLSTAADGVILVASVGKTTFDVLNTTLSNINKAKGRVFGIVLNRVPRKGMGATYYGYQYTGEYYQSTDKKKK